MNDEKAAAAIGRLLLGLLGVTFIVLKLIGVIDWSWWWVTAPFWGSFALSLIILIVVIIVALAIKAINHFRN